MEKERKVHESYGIIDIARFTSSGTQFFGSDLVHNGGITITIKKGAVERKLNSEWYFGEEELIEVQLSNNQFIDAITSGMNTSGVPCTIKHFNGSKVQQIEFVEDKKEMFSKEMTDVNSEYVSRINGIVAMLDGNIGKRKLSEIKHELSVLKNHIASNTDYVVKCFKEEMEKTVTEAKHTISNYVDHKIHQYGIEAMKKEIGVSIETDQSNLQSTSHE